MFLFLTERQIIFFISCEESAVLSFSFAQAKSHEKWKLPFSAPNSSAAYFKLKLLIKLKTFPVKMNYI